MSDPYILEVEGLRKSFGGVAALQNGEFRLRHGSVHALCGGNGAGKSTFLSIIMGIQQRDSGVIKLDGRPVSFAKPAEALAAGIAIIEQELSPILDMTVAENIFLGREHKGRFGGIDFASMNRESSALLNQLGFDIDSKAMMRSLSVGQIQLVEIAKALSHEARIIIMDEPTSALGEKEVDSLLEAIRRLKAQGKGIIYVSHRLTEIFDIVDYFTVFRDGSFVSSGSIGDIDRSRLINLIVGRELRDEFIKENIPDQKIRLSVRNLGRAGKLSNISFDVRRGEILGFYGLMGAGRTELLDCLFGIDTLWTGTVTIDGQPANLSSPSHAMRAGLALVTEDRKQSGLIIDGSVRSNLSLSVLPQLSPGGVMDTAKEVEWSERTIKRFRIKAVTDRLPVSSLSGGNQQKVVIGRCYLTEPGIMLFDEPTRGVDVGAKREIYGIMSDFAKAGGSIIMVSGELEEILGMSDRIVVIRAGSVVGTLDRAEASQQTLVHLAT
jgi:putative xylitol transport system ATP-binding protein